MFGDGCASNRSPACLRLKEHLTMPARYSWALLAIALTLAPAGACAHAYPTKPIRFITSAPGGIGGQSHLAAELFRSMTGVNFVNVNYKGTGPAIQGLIAGEVQIMFCNATIAAPFIKSGKVRPLGVGSLERSPLLPEL